MRLAEFPQFRAQTSRSPANYKLQPYILQHELDLAEAIEIPVTIQKRARRPLYPLNLRANGDGWNPTYAAGQGITVWYDGSDPRRSAQGPTATLIPDIEVVTVEMLTMAGELRAAFQYTTYGAKTISNAQIIAALGAETDFVLRAWFEGGGAVPWNQTPSP